MTQSDSIGADETPLPPRRANLPVTFGSRLELLTIKALFFLFRLMGIEGSSALAGGVMRVTGPLIRPLSRRGEENLRLVFPDWSEARIRSTIAGVWENLGRTAAEFAHLKKLAPFGPASRVEVVGAEHLQRVAASRRPAIFVSGHFANWEVMSITLRAAGIDYGVVYRAANNPLVDEMIIRLRAEVMSRLQIPKGKRSSRPLVETLSRGKSLAMLVDQKLNDGISVPFLGKDAMTAPSAARLSLKFDAPIYPASVERLGGARFRVLVGAPIDYAPTGETDADVRALTMLINDRIGESILARPEQWLWLHRRWPAQPAP